MEDNIVWVDLEMTDLDLKRGTVIEIACIVTDKELNVLGSPVQFAIHHPDEVLDSMNPWCIKHHGEVRIHTYNVE